VAVGRAFTDTFSGIAPSSLPGFVVAELVGLVLGVGLVAVLYPRAGRGAEQVVFPREEGEPAGVVPAGQGNG
jgi:arsenate reductase